LPSCPAPTAPRAGRRGRSHRGRRAASSGEWSGGSSTESGRSRSFVWWGLGARSWSVACGVSSAI